MRFPRLISLLTTVLLFGSLAAEPQSSHRRRGPRPPQGPNVFDRMEEERRQEEERALAKKRTEETAARERRRAERAKLARELPQLIERAQQLESRVNSDDFEKTLPAELRQQARELERLARQIHKRVRAL
jgi:hypothetical protein